MLKRILYEILHLFATEVERGQKDIAYLGKFHFSKNTSSEDRTRDLLRVKQM